MKMVGILISNKCITVYSLKGNTLGILEKLDMDKFEFCRINKQDPTELWNKSDLILLGSSTYYASDVEDTYCPKYLIDHLPALRELKNKKIVIFGSGRSEYTLFCGVVDYLYELLHEKNNIITYKFEGYPREKQKIEFKNIIEEVLING
jgi:flavodoxin